MTTVNVLWLSYQDDIPAKGYWDQGLLEAVFDLKVWHPASGFEFRHVFSFDDVTDGAVVVVPARSHYDYAERINEDLKRLSWVVLIIGGDEENLFPIEKIHHPNIMIYLMTPNFNKDQSRVDRFIGDGWPQAAPVELRKMDQTDRPVDVFFAGQVTHQRRKSCVQALNSMQRNFNVEVAPSPGFTQGLPPRQYYERMTQAKMVACPSGPVSVDTFRFFEALEAGCLPMADIMTPSGSSNKYWEKLFGREDLPFPLVNDWQYLDAVTSAFLGDWKYHVNKTFAWWQNYKRDFVYRLNEDIASLSGRKPQVESDHDRVTVLIPTSPIPSHPSTAIIEETVRSVREYLPTQEIIIMIDGCREEQEDMRDNYSEYIRNLLWLCNNKWNNVLPVVFEDHQHQVAMTRRCLDLVKTQHILFVEHDTPIGGGDIDVTGLLDALDSGQCNFIRLHHEAEILDVHKYLMLDNSPVLVAGVPMMRTAQWSQRPHFANATFYRRFLAEYFTPGASSMIEDRMYGILVCACDERGKAGWNDFKVWVYTPETPSIKRSLNLDGRGKDQPKYDMVF